VARPLRRQRQRQERVDVPDHGARGEQDAHHRLRSSRRRILPLGDTGTASMNSISRTCL
jgi:hypothetical protein